MDINKPLKSETLSIGQVSHLVGLDARTIRFYEDSGLISPVERADNGYRYFTQQSVTELKLIKAVRELGLPISEMKKLMRGCQDQACEHSQNQIQHSIEAYIQVLDQRIKQFILLKSKLQQLKGSLEMNEETCEGGLYCCNILGQLVETPAANVQSQK